MPRLILSLAFLFFTCALQAQTRADINNSEVPLTWLGVDYTQVKFIGDATQWQDAGEITNSQMRDKYFPAWNDLFVNEQTKYDVAKYTNRSEVNYQIQVANKANNKMKTPKVFSNDPEDFARLSESDIQKLIKGYDFMGNKGLGLLFVVEGMSKGKSAASVWVVFVNMNNKSVLLAKQVEEKAGGFGFRNYWAKPLFLTLKNLKSDLKKWSK